MGMLYSFLKENRLTIAPSSIFILSLIAYQYCCNSTTSLQMKLASIILAEDHQFVAEGLKELLEKGNKWRVSAIARNGRQAISFVQKYQPDLLITDLNMPDRDGFSLIAEVRIRFPSLKIIVISMYSAPAILKKVMELGVQAYLLKEQNAEEVLNAVDIVLRGETYENIRLNHKKTDAKIFTDDFKAKNRLTEREVQILQLIAQSFTNKEIGKKLYISEYTVQTHRRNLKRKLKADNTADLVRFAYDNQLIKAKDH
ncbi:MAG: response regulator transcription factor [Bacteroidetes bacterium]|nr:response regulator transcription factor [Bacteroidota bacterium]